MSVNNTLERLTEVIRDILNIEDIEITATTTSDDVEGWDSLAHVRIVVATEAEFAIRFSTYEVAALTSVGSIVDLIDSKISSQPQI